MQHVVEPVHFVSSSRMNLSFYGLYNLTILLDEPIYLLILLCIRPLVDLIILTLMGWTCSLMYLWAQLYQLTFMG